MNRRRAILGAALALAALPILGGPSGCDGQKATADLPESKVSQVKPNATVYVSPDLFPNIVTYCLPGGYRAFLTTRDASAAAARVLPDEDCRGKEAGESPAIGQPNDLTTTIPRVIP